MATNFSFLLTRRTIASARPELRRGFIEIDSISKRRRPRIPRSHAVRGVLLERHSSTASLFRISAASGICETPFGLGPCWGLGRNCGRWGATTWRGLVPFVDAGTPFIWVRRLYNSRTRSRRFSGSSAAGNRPGASESAHRQGTPGGVPGSELECRSLESFAITVRVVRFSKGRRIGDFVDTSTAP